HLVDGALSIMGTVGEPGNTRTFTATVIGHDSPRDTALLQLQGASGLQTPAFGVSATVTPGQPVIVVGHAPARGPAPAMILGIVADAVRRAGCLCDPHQDGDAVGRDDPGGQRAGVSSVRCGRGTCACRQHTTLLHGAYGMSDMASDEASDERENGRRMVTQPG